MKILFFVPDLSISGGQTVVSILSRYLSKTDEVAVIVNTEKTYNKLVEKMIEANVKLYFLRRRHGKNLIHSFSILNKIRLIIKNFEPDIISVHLDYRYMWIYSFLYKEKMYFTVHSQAYRLYSVLNKILLNYLNQHGLVHYILLSEENAKEFEAVFKLGKESYTIIPNPVEIEEYEKKEKDYKKSSITRFVNIARFNPIKNHKLLVDAFSIALEKYNSIELHLIGEGELYSEVKHYVEELRIEGKILFHGEVSDIGNILNRSDVAIMSSKSECFPMFILESMSAGLPIIATNVGGIHDMISGNGMLVNNDDVTDLAEKIVLMAKTPDLQRKMGQISKLNVRKYDATIISQKYRDLFLRDSCRFCS